MRGDESDQSVILNALTIPNVLRRNQAWVIVGLNQFRNTVALLDANGAVVYRSLNNESTIRVDKLAAGFYFYQIITTDQNGKQTIYKGKLMISD